MSEKGKSGNSGSFEAEDDVELGIAIENAATSEFKRLVERLKKESIEKAKGLMKETWEKREGEEKDNGSS